MEPQSPRGLYALCILVFSKILRPLDRIFNAIFSSKYNPLYQSGTISVVLFATALVTGLYLVVFYRVGAPYASMERISSAAWGAKYIRSLHLYSADAAMVMIVLHILRKLAQGKTWGKRTLAWMTGAGLLSGFLLTGWTGFVMVWDLQGQAVARALSKVFDVSGLFADPITRSFDGAMGDPPSSFFFMILFLHIVLPLGLIFVLWIHTSMQSRPAWFPSRKFSFGLVGALLIAALVSPAPLASRANLLKVQTGAALNWFYNFWVPWAYTHPRATLWGALALFIIFIFIPFWLRPPRDKRASSLSFQKRPLRSDVSSSFPVPSSLRSSVRVAVGALFIVMLSATHQISATWDPHPSYLRLSWRLISQREKQCQERSQEELDKLPRHMRTPQVCTYSPVDYELTVLRNGQSELHRVVSAGGLRNDRPLYVLENIPLAPGRYDIEIKFRPMTKRENDFLTLSFASQIEIRAGQIALIHLTPDGRSLSIKQE